MVFFRNGQIQTKIVSTLSTLNTLTHVYLHIMWLPITNIKLLANTGKMEAGDDEKTALISVRGWEMGEPIARPSIWRGKQVVLVACILFTELCERLTFYSVTANLLLYGTTVLDLESTTATSVSLYFTG